jgi:hypothetical protein
LIATGLVHSDGVDGEDGTVVLVTDGVAALGFQAMVGEAATPCWLPPHPAKNAALITPTENATPNTSTVFRAILSFTFPDWLIGRPVPDRKQ